jgi:hypothetical protein
MLCTPPSSRAHPLLRLSSSASCPQLLKWLAQVLDSYWHDVLKQDVIKTSVKHYEKLVASGDIESESQAVECDKCKKWRRVSKREIDIIDGRINADGTPGDGKERKWFCYMVSLGHMDTLLHAVGAT